MSRLDVLVSNLDAMNQPTGMDELRVSTSVRLAETEDGAVLLDIRQGLCFAMESVGTQIWRMLVKGRSLGQIQDRLVSLYPDVPRERLEEDVAQFIRALKEKELVGCAEASSPPILLTSLVKFGQKSSRTRQPAKSRHAARHFLFWRALLYLIAFDLFGFGSNFSRTYELVRRLRTTAAQSQGEAAGRVCRAVNYACICYPKRVLCLQRSAVTTCLLRLCGIPAEMVLGAQKFPFKAHAWTEVNRQPVNEGKDVQKLYLVWDRC